MFGNFVAGTVGADGKPVAGEGFTAELAGQPGIITVTFLPGWIFTEPPAVVATQIHPDKDDPAITPNTLSNVVIRWVTPHKFQIVTGAPNGLPLGRKFSFVAIGIMGTPKK